MTTDAERLAASKARRLRWLLNEVNDPDAGAVTPALAKRRRALREEIEKLRAEEGVPILSAHEIARLPK